MQRPPFFCGKLGWSAARHPGFGGTFARGSPGVRSSGMKLCTFYFHSFSICGMISRNPRRLRGTVLPVGLGTTNNAGRSPAGDPLPPKRTVPWGNIAKIDSPQNYPLCRGAGFGTEKSRRRAAGNRPPVFLGPSLSEKGRSFWTKKTLPPLSVTGRHGIL